jgi:hypothetical protein
VVTRVLDWLLAGFWSDMVRELVNEDGLSPLLACEVAFGATGLREKIARSNLPLDLKRAALAELDQAATAAAAESFLPFR